MIPPEIAATSELLRILQTTAGDLDPQIERHGDHDTNVLTVSLRAGKHAIDRTQFPQRLRLVVEMEYTNPNIGNVTYVQWRKGLSQYGPIEPYLPPGHGAAPFPCKLCGEILGNGKPVQLHIIGPEPEDQEAHAAEKPYYAVAEYYHLKCLQGEIPPSLARLIGVEPENTAAHHAAEPCYPQRELPGQLPRHRTPDELPRILSRPDP